MRKHSIENFRTKIFFDEDQNGFFPQLFWSIFLG